MKLTKIITFTLFLLLVKIVSGQYSCVQNVISQQENCRTTFPQCGQLAIIEKADALLHNPSTAKCLNSVGFLYNLSDFYVMAVVVPDGSLELGILALDKAIDLIKKAGEIDSSTVQKNGEGALRLLLLYEMKRNVYVNYGNDAKLMIAEYDSATANQQYRAEIYNGKNEIIELLPPDSKAETVLNTSKTTLLDTSKVVEHYYKPVHNPKYIVKPIFVMAYNIDSVIPLVGEQLTIKTAPEADMILSGNPARFKYSISFEEGLEYMVTISYPGYENQYFPFVSTQVPEYDTLRSYLIPLDNSYFYTRYSKRAFLLDSFSIVILRNKSASERTFNELIDSLNLKQDKINKILYRQSSGEPFYGKNNGILEVLRSHPSLVEVAGTSLGRNGEINILTNQMKIIWNKNSKEFLEKDILLKREILEKHELTDLGNGFFAAPLGIGFEINTLIHELNQYEIVKLAFPETYGLLSAK